MKAIAYEDYGSADVLELREVAQPVVPDDGVLVRVRAVSVNPLDWHFLPGTPFLMRMVTGRGPTARTSGSMWPGGRSGRQERDAVQPGDEVFGVGKGPLPSTRALPRSAWS